MDNRKIVLNNMTIKTEPNATAPKKVFLSSSPFPQLPSKSLSNTRLASFKAPRDLLLTGSTTRHSNSTFSINSSSKGTKRTFMPNINVTRKKGQSETIANESINDANHKNKEKEKNKKGSVAVGSKKRNMNIVQTQGVFSEGLAPGKVKAFGNTSYDRVYNERQILDKPKLNLTRKVCKNEEDTKLKLILKDDFLDDPSLVPDIGFAPNSLPIVYNVKKNGNDGDLDKTFETLQVKAEKVTSLDVNKLKCEKPDMASLFDQSDVPKLLLFEFPNVFAEGKEDPPEKKKPSKGQPAETDKLTGKTEGLSSLGEGYLGCLRIHENGKAYFVFGNTTVPLCMTRHNTRQEVMSTGFDGETSKGEVISLGTVDGSFTCSANFFQDVS